MNKPHHRPRSQAVGTWALGASIAVMLTIAPVCHARAQEPRPSPGIVPPHLAPVPPGDSSAGPDMMPPEIANQFQGQSRATANAPSQGNQEKATGGSYIYNTLRVIHQSASRGCSSGDWSCMTNLCKADLGPDAWRGWSGCDNHDEGYICFFECSQVRKKF